MKGGFWSRLDILTRQSTPFLLTLALVIINQVPIHIPGFSQVMPLLPLMAIYHWALFRPELMPAYAVFIIGLMQDALSGTPVGINALVYLAVYGTVLSQERFFSGKSFVVVWLGFGLIAAAASLAVWALVSAWYAAIVAPQAVIFQYLLTTGFFPVVVWVFLRWQKSVLGSV